MHHTESNLIEINDKIKSKINSLSLNQYNPKVIAVSKTFKEQDILPLLDYGTYKANWRALGGDGHVMKGSFSFKIVGK